MYDEKYAYEAACVEMKLSAGDRAVMRAQREMYDAHEEWQKRVFMATTRVGEERRASFLGPLRVR